MNDREGATHLVKGKAGKRVKKIWADMGYRGKQLRDFMKMKRKDLEIVLRPRRWFWVTQEQIERGEIPVVPSFTVLPRRWVVERTFAWIGRYRRMSKDYEYKIQTSTVMLFLCLVRTFLKRLCKAC
jgi:putative transposase